ncbi:MAG TPA: DUF2059 domain-containing protein [Acidobacteriaceae bacterium]
MPIRVPFRSLALLLVFALTVPVAARADDASHRAKAKELMTLLKTEHMVIQISDAIRKQVSDAAAQVVGPDASPERKAKYDDFMKQAGQAVDEQLSWKTMEGPFTDIYVKTFTEEELDSIIAFYKSPAGTTLLEKMPSVNDQVSRYGQSKMVTLQPQLKQLYAEFQKNAAAAPPTLGPAPSAPGAPALKPATPAAPPK